MSEKNIISLKENDDPYFRALTIFTKISEISNLFPKKYRENNNNPNLPKELNSMDEIFQYNISEENKKGKDIFKNNPKKLFYFILDKLHELYKNSKEDDYEENLIEGAMEVDVDKAKSSFKKKMEKNRSEISDLFYGERLIKKTCSNCRLENYKYENLKMISIDTSKFENTLKLENILDKIQEREHHDYFCEFCQKKQLFTYSITIEKKPNILIILFYNFQGEPLIDIPMHIFDGSYKLISAEIKEPDKFYDDITISSLFTMFGLVVKKICKRKKGDDYKILYDKKAFLFKKNEKNELEEESIKFKIPYVLFYKNIEDKTSHQKNKRSQDDNDLSENYMITKEKNNNEQKTEIDNNIEDNQNNNLYKLNQRNFDTKEKMNNIDNSNNNTNYYNNNINNNNNYYNNNNIINNNTNYNNDDEICLYFRFTENQKELYIEVNEDEIIENIIKKLISKYDTLDNNIFNEYSFYFKNKKITNFKKTAKQLGLISDSYITVQKK